MLGGGGFVSRLMQEVREKRGYAYSVYSYFAPRKLEGPFEIGLQTKREQADDAIKVVEEVLAKFLADGPTEKELAAAKKNLVDGLALRIDSNAKILGYLSAIGFYGLPLTYLDDFPAKINAVTVADVKAAFARHVQAGTSGHGDRRGRLSGENSHHRRRMAQPPDPGGRCRGPAADARPRARDAVQLAGAGPVGTCTASISSPAAASSASRRPRAARRMSPWSRRAAASSSSCGATLEPFACERLELVCRDALKFARFAGAALRYRVPRSALSSGLAR